MWDTIDGSCTYLQKSLKTLAVIGISEKDPQIVYIQYYTTAKEAWRKLSNVDENSGVANNMHLMEELKTAKMAGEEKAKANIENFRSVFG